MRADFVSIHDDMYGEGTELAFPAMSTCSASIAVLGDRLVGVHKTMDNEAGDLRGRWTKTHLKILEAAALLIKDGGGARELYIAGWRVTAAGGRHEAAPIQAALSCSDVPTYICKYADSFKIGKSGAATAYTHFGGGHKKANDVCTFAFHRHGGSPVIGIKRTNKVAIVVQKLGKQGGEEQVETIETPSDHLHELKKFIEFGRAPG
jgi:hypothetical protein